MAHAQLGDRSRTAVLAPAPAAPGPPPSFQAVLTHRYAGRLLAASVAGRLPLGMVPIALLLAVKADGHSLATAGALAALYGIAPAAGLPVLGRLADRRGLVLPCRLGAFLVAAALGVLACTGTANLAVAAVCVVVAGAGCPPLEGGLRSLWPSVLPDAAHVRTACTLDASAQEVVYVAGPALSVAVTGWLSPAAALALAASATVAGSLVFSTAAPARSWRAAGPRRGDRLGALRPPEVRLLLTALVFVGVSVGALDVAGIAAAGQAHAGWLAGALPAVFSAAGLAGGMLFARLQPGGGVRVRQLLWLGAVFAGAWLPLLAPLPAWQLLALVVLPGVVFVPLLTAASLTLTAWAPAGTSTEAVGWMSSAIRLGVAGGTALAGPLGGTFVLPLLAAVVCALLLSACTAPAPASG